MRVNLTYSVKFDEVKLRVAELIKESSKKTKDVADAMERTAIFLPTEQNNIARMEIDRIRTELASIDHRLSDCETILRSYQETAQRLEYGLGFEENCCDEEEDMNDYQKGAENDEEG